MYAIYKQKRYRAVMKDGVYRISSPIQEEGFVYYVDVLGRVHTDCFERRVSGEELEDFFDENWEVKYGNKYFLLFKVPTMDELEQGYVFIYSDDYEYAKANGFERHEPAVYYKRITVNEIENIKVTRVSTKEFGDKVEEDIIVGNDIDKWLKAHVVKSR